MESLKKANDAHVLNTARLEEEKVELEQSLASCRLQLNKLEMKVSVADENLANKEDLVERKAAAARNLEARLGEVSRLLEEERDARRQTEAGEKEAREVILVLNIYRGRGDILT